MRTDRGLKMFTKTKLFSIFCLLMAGLSLNAQDIRYDVIEAEGVVQGLNLENNSVLIDGRSYRVAHDAKVEIRGTFGAFSLLVRGMKVAYVFRRFDETSREIVEIKQLSDNRQMEQT